MMVCNHTCRNSFISRILLLFGVLAVIPGCIWAESEKPWDNGKLTTSDDGHFLVHENGKPIFILGDDSWELTIYLEDRAAKKYNLIMGAALPEYYDGKGNAYGHLPLHDRNPAAPIVVDGPDNDYWDNVEWIIDEAARLGEYIGFVIAWGRVWVNSADLDSSNNVFRTQEQIDAYAKFVVDRYGGKPNIIWYGGGDILNKPADDSAWTKLGRDHTFYHGVYHAMKICQKIAELDSGRHLMSWHTARQAVMSDVFKDTAWMSFYSFQSGHGNWEPSFNNYTFIEHDYALTNPTKPTMVMESAYEQGYRQTPEGWFTETPVWDDNIVRVQSYWPVFAGGFGYNYGHNNIWQMSHANSGQVTHGVDIPWDEAMKAPGSQQMTYLMNLIESRPILARVPDQSIISGTNPGGMSYDHIQATRGEDYLFVYIPTGRNFQINMGKISGTEVKGWWYDTRDGSAEEIGTFDNEGTREFDPPGEPAVGNDWVLALDDVNAGYPAPGQEDYIWQGQSQTRVYEPGSSLAPGRTLDAVEGENAILFGLDGRRIRKQSAHTPAAAGVYIRATVHMTGFGRVAIP
jgi:hypothetical protein